ncbi:MAG: hypothetical protein L6R28_00945 [Planctomycetes bacterium]|nr:hypothetical protein [Planctomycetota bacterium]
MPALENDTLAQREARPVPERTVRASALSQALRAIRDELVRTDPLPVPEAQNGARRFTVRVAGDLSSRLRAYRLAYALYRQKGYVAEDQRAMVVEPYDAQAQTFTLLAEDEGGRAVGTVSLVFDSDARLPCADLYGEEVATMQAGGRRLAEVTRLAVAPDCGGEKQLLVRLFNLAYVYARRVMGCTDFVIEVNPRHAPFYRRALLFEAAGTQRPCPRVNGAPALLLRLDLDLGEELVACAPNDPLIARTLYPYFQEGRLEEELARRLKAQQRTLTADEAARLGLALRPEPVSNKRVALRSLLPEKATERGAG